MSDTATTPLPNPVIPEGASTESLFNLYTNQEPGDPSDMRVPPKQKAAEPTVETPTVTKPDAKPVTATDDSIPDQFLGGKKEDTKPEDDWDKFVKEEPQGQIKHEHYKRQREIAQKRIDALAGEVQQAREKLEAAEKRGVPEDILNRTKQLEETLAEREAVLERIAVQESPKFKERYTAKEAAIAERLKKAATEFGLDAEQLQQAMGSSLKRRAELMDNIDLSPSARSAIDSLMTQHDFLQDDKQQFLAQSREAHAAWQAEQKEQTTAQERQRAEYEDRTFTSVMDEMAKTYAPFQEVEGNEAWNAQARALREEARKYFNGQVELPELARAVIRGVGAPVQDKIIAKQQAAIRALQDEVAGLKTAQPGSNGHLATPDGKVDMSQMSAEERMKATWAQHVSPNSGF